MTYKSRFLLIVHIFIVTTFIYSIYESNYCQILLFPVILLAPERLFVKIYTWKRFCPSVFLYLCSVVPAVWLLELYKVKWTRINCLLYIYMENLNLNLNLNFSTMTEQDLKKYMEDDIPCENSWITLISQSSMLILIINRWMLPKGKLTRDQLSQLLLAYIGMSADIVEFLGSLNENLITKEPILVYMILIIWTWSLLQFTILPATAQPKRFSLSSSSNINLDEFEIKSSCCNIDLWETFMDIIFQDGPFLIFRLMLLIYYNMINYENIFFTCKNILMILLQLYRLCVILTNGKTLYELLYEHV